MKVIIAILTVVIAMPIWYYLLYKILQGVNASEVMWLLYWVYVPVGLLVHIMGKIAESAQGD